MGYTVDKLTGTRPHRRHIAWIVFSWMYLRNEKKPLTGHEKFYSKHLKGDLFHGSGRDLKFFISLKEEIGKLLN